MTDLNRFLYLSRFFFLTFYFPRQDGLLLHWDSNTTRSQLRAGFSLGAENPDIKISNLMGDSLSLGVNSVDVVGDLLIAGTDNEAVLLFNQLPVF
jgi:hypothetical protein